MADRESFPRPNALALWPVALAAAVMLAGCAGGPEARSGSPTSPSTQAPTTMTSTPSVWPGEYPHYAGFEKQLADWVPMADMAAARSQADPGWRVAVTPPGHAPSQFSVRFEVDGRDGGGTVWIAKPLQMRAGATHTFNVSLHVYVPQAFAGTVAHVVATMAAAAPGGDEDFPALGQNSARDEFGAGGLREAIPGEAGWHEHRFTWRGTVPASGRLHLAVGIATQADEELAFHIDDVHVT